MLFRSAYFPNGQAPDSDKFAYKMRWLDALRDWLQAELAQHPRLVLMGDYNITFDELDVWDPVTLEGTIHCTEEERYHLRALIALDRDLHRQIWAMAGNEMLEQTLEWLFSHVLRRWNVSIDRSESLGSVMQMHDQLAEAIVAGRAADARDVMARHVAGFQASLVP